MKHCILARFVPEVAKERKAQLLPEIKTLFDETLEIPGISAVEVIPNCVDRDNRYDVLIRLTMAPEALPLYDACQAHKKWKADYASLLQNKAIFDYE